VPKQTLARELRTDKQLHDAADHVRYELEMLVYSAQHLGGWHSSPMTMPGGADRNMALECFLLHFRNLRAFLCPSLHPPRAADIVASDLHTPTAKDLGNPQALDAANKDLLDQMLAHLTYLRSDHIAVGGGGWNTGVMLLAMSEQLKTFFASLPEHMADWFPRIVVEGQA
jgi:hypothetical protein